MTPDFPFLFLANSMNDTLLTPAEVQKARALAGNVLEQLNAALLGQEALHHMVMVGILSRGHILLEGVPGVGKTAMIRTLGQALSLDFKRVQFTPDLMPGDILGATLLQETEAGARKMVFEPGPIFTHILLADEINRASPKTQSALLEAMQERRVTAMGVSRELPDPFFVLASQNPIEQEGTYPLPEAQLDRFLFKLQVARPGPGVMEEVILSRRRGEAPATRAVLDAKGMQELFAAMERVALPRQVARYAARLVASTHADDPEASDQVRKYVSCGASPRAAIAIAEAARANALLSGRPSAGFEDVKAVASAVLNHRLVLDYQARIDRVDAHAIVAGLLKGMDPAGLNLPAGVAVA